MPIVGVKKELELNMKKSLVFIMVVATCISACRKKGCTDSTALNYDSEAKKDDGTCVEDTTYTIPATYNFENVSYSGQIARLQLLDALVDKITEGDSSTVVSKQELIDIYENTNGLFESTKKLSDKTYVGVQQEFYTYFEDLANATANGTGQEIDGRYYTADGIEIKQMVEKGLMGAVFYYQATSHYLENLSTDDNITIEEGKGTDMEHHFDEAFGYFGAPIDFSTNDQTEGSFTTTSWYWAKYCLARDAQLGNRETIFNAFLAARAAISNNDYSERDVQVNIIIEEWEKLVAANVVHYINSTISDIAANNVGDKYHHWNEGKAFAQCLSYNVNKSISTANITLITDAFGISPNDVTSSTDFDNALSVIKSNFGFTDSQMLNF